MLAGQSIVLLVAQSGKGELRSLTINPFSTSTLTPKQAVTSNMLSSVEEKTSMVHVMNGANSTLQTSPRERTLAPRIAEASRSLPGDRNPCFTNTRSLVTRFSPALEDSILAKSNGARHINDNQRIKIYVVCHWRLGVEREANTDSRRYTSLGRNRTISDGSRLRVYLLLCSHGFWCSGTWFGSNFGAELWSLIRLTLVGRVLVDLLMTAVPNRAD